MGFIAYDFRGRFPEAQRRVAVWVESGALHVRETVVEGFENVPKAFLGLFTGTNLGKMIVRVEAAASTSHLDAATSAEARVRTSPFCGLPAPRGALATASAPGSGGRSGLRRLPVVDRRFRRCYKGVSRILPYFRRRRFA